MRKWVAIGGVLSLAGAVLAAGCLEITMRLLSPHALDFYDWQKIKRVSNQPGQSFEYIPGSQSDFYVGVPVRINRLGFRDQEIEDPKPSGTIRILGLGDSVTFGFGVRLEETYLKVLESELNSHAPAGGRHQVVNAGREGTGLDDYYRVFESSAPIVDPDLVVIGIALNDITDYAAHGSSSEQDRREFSERSLVRRLNTFLLHRSHLYLASYQRMKSLLYRFGWIDFNQEHWYDVEPLLPPSPRQEEAWASTGELLRRIAALAKAKGLPMAWVIFPMELQLDPSLLALYRRELGIAVGEEALRGEPQRRLVELGASLGVPVLDLLPVFRAAGPRELFLRNSNASYDPVHPSALGHRVAGRELCRFLTAAGLGLRQHDRSRARSDPPS